MVKVIAAVALALMFAQDPPKQQDKPGQDRPGQDRAANQDLDTALSKASQMNNYTASISMRKDGTPQPGGRDMGLNAIEFRVMPSAAWHVKSGEIEGYRQGDVFITKEGGAWKRFDGATDRKAGDRRDGDKRDGDKRDGEKREGDRRDGDKRSGDTQDKGAISNEKLASLRAPHEMLKDLKSSSFKQIRREDNEGSRIFSGDLTDEAVRSILATKKGASGDRQQMGTGSAKIWVNGEGLVTKYELTIDHKAQPGQTGGETGKMTKTVEFREVGSTKYEVPADATKALGSKTTDRPTDRPTDQPKDQPKDKPMDDDKKDEPKKEDNK